jgi:hypothetical protein
MLVRQIGRKALKPTILIKIAASIAVLVFARVASAQSGLTLTITDQSGNTTNLTDSGSGKVFFSGALNNSIWDGNFEVADTYPNVGRQSAPEVDLDIQNACSTGAGSLTFTLTETGWPSLGANAGTAYLAVSGAGDAGCVTASGFVNGSPVLTTGVLSDDPWTTNIEGNASGFESTFSIGESVVLVHCASGAGLGDFDFSVIPEPSAFVLVGLGVAGLLLIRRRGK